MKAAEKKVSLNELNLGDVQKERLNRSIGQYRRAGIDIALLDGSTVRIEQKKLINGYILNNKQLYDRAREVFEGIDVKIIPVVYSLDVGDISIEWVEEKMHEFGINRKDLIRQLAIDQSTLSLYFSKARGLTHTTKAAFFYYFLTYELNRDFRKE